MTTLTSRKIFSTQQFNDRSYGLTRRHNRSRFDVMRTTSYGPPLSQKARLNMSLSDLKRNARLAKLRAKDSSAKAE